MAVGRALPGGPSIEERIARGRGSLTATERRLASLLTDDPTRWAFATVAEVAEMAGTSGPTVVRFAATLGFTGFGQLQDQLRDDVTERLRRPSDRLRLTTGPIDHSAALDAVGTTFERLDHDRLESMAHTLADAEGRVWVVASESSSPVAHLLAANLGLIRPGIVHISGFGPSTAASISDASDSDAAIAIDFPRYERAVVSMTSSLHERGVRVTALTDGPLSPLVDIAAHWCGVDVPSVGPFDSAVPTVAVAEVIIALVAARLGDHATHRLDAVERQWDRDEVFATGDRTGDAESSAR